MGDGHVIEAAFDLAMAAAMVLGPGRAALYAGEDGVRIRNPFSSRTIRWDDIRGFRIGRHGPLGAVCIVDLADGGSAYAFGIQMPNVARKPKEPAMVAELNRMLAERRPAWDLGR